MSPQEDDTSSLERARNRLYKVGPAAPESRPVLSVSGDRVLPHVWHEEPPPQPQNGKKHMRFAGMFFIGATLFFIVSLGIAGYLLYFGGNSVSVDKVALDITGPLTIAGGDTVPLTLTITNKNPVAISNATIEIDFPDGTRDATNVVQAYPRYVENIGTLESGATITRSLKAAIFGGAGQKISLPVSFSYGMAGSNSSYVKRSSYELAISSTPIEVSVGAPLETVSGKPLTFTVTVRSNTTVPLSNVVLAGAFPFGFAITSSSVPASNSSFLLGTLAPGATKTVTLTGTLTGQNNEQRVFHFSVGTAKTANDQTLAVTFMTQDATVAITAPFINTTLALNGDTSANVTVGAGKRQSVTVSYANTLPTSVSNVVVAITISGSAVDYGSIETSRGFYRSTDHTVIFSQDTDPALANLAPGASGLGTFSFTTLSAGTLTASPTITFTTSVSGTRVGQANVPETVNASATKTAKVLTAVAFGAATLHASGPLTNSGPIPPVAEQATTYSIVWNVRNQGSTIADSTVSATLPSYVSYTGKTAGTGSFSYDSTSRTVTWSAGDLLQGGSAQGIFQVSLTPSTSQKGSAPTLTSSASFTGYDRFAGVQIKATADSVSTQATGDPGYVLLNGTVQ